MISTQTYEMVEMSKEARGTLFFPYSLYGVEMLLFGLAGALAVQKVTVW